MTLEYEEEDQQQQQPKIINTSLSSETSEDPQSVPTLLPEIIVEILFRVSVESLLRCRAVCKLWYSIISDSHFVKSHLSFSSNSNLYARYRLIFNTEPRLVLKGCPLYDVLYDESVKFPLKYPPKSVLISGSCNGLLLLVIEEDTPFIWNPSTRKSNILPYCGFEMRLGARLFFGFGYDESTDDYKVVGIYQIFRNGGKYDKRVMMYSLKTGNWKEIGEFPHDTLMDDSGKFSNGALHWVNRESSDSWKIVSLDLAKETYGEISQPVYDKGDRELTLGALGERLCVMCNYRGDKADVWVMKVYGVNDSWTKLVSIPYLSDPHWDKFSVPLCITNDGKVLLQFGGNLVVYDSKNHSSSEIQNFDECLEAYIFVESLVSPESPNSRP